MVGRSRGYVGYQATHLFRSSQYFVGLLELFRMSVKVDVTIMGYRSVTLVLCSNRRKCMLLDPWINSFAAQLVCLGRHERLSRGGGEGRLYESDVSYHMLNCRDSIEICFMPYCKCNRNEYFYTRHSQVGIHPICGILFHL